MRTVPAGQCSFTGCRGSSTKSQRRCTAERGLYRSEALTSRRTTDRFERCSGCPAEVEITATRTRVDRP